MSNLLSNNVSLTIDKQSMTFLYSDDHKIVLDIGYETVIQHYFKDSFKGSFKGSVPTPYEIEMAIIAIEDAIEAIYKQWQPVENVFTNNEQVKAIAMLASNNNIIDSIQLESFFNRVADVIAGSPKQENEFPDTLEFIAILLIIRELVHHLGIKRIELR